MDIENKLLNIHKNFSSVGEDTINFTDDSNFRIRKYTKLRNITEIKKKRIKKIVIHLGLFIISYAFVTLCFGEKEVPPDATIGVWTHNGEMVYETKSGTYDVYIRDGIEYYKRTTDFVLYFILLCTWPLFVVLKNIIEIFFNNKKLEDDMGLLEISKNKLKIYVHFKEEYDIDNLIADFENKQISDELNK